MCSTYSVRSDGRAVCSVPHPGYWGVGVPSSGHARTTVTLEIGSKASGIGSKTLLPGCRAEGEAEVAWRRLLPTKLWIRVGPWLGSIDPHPKPG